MAKLLCHRYIADRLKDLWNLSQIGAKLLIENYKLVLYVQQIVYQGARVFK